MILLLNDSTLSVVVLNLNLSRDQLLVWNPNMLDSDFCVLFWNSLKCIWKAIVIGIENRHTYMNRQQVPVNYTLHNLQQKWHFFAEECVTERGKEQCEQLAGKLDDAFRHLLKKRLSYDRTDEIMMNIKEIRALLRPISRKYNVEHFTSMKQYSEHCGIKYGELTWQYYEI